VADIIPERVKDQVMLSPRLLALESSPTPRKEVVEMIAMAKMSETMEIHLEEIKLLTIGTIMSFWILSSLDMNADWY
jgi:hypothetical protein